MINIFFQVASTVAKIPRLLTQSSPISTTCLSFFLATCLLGKDGLKPKFVCVEGGNPSIDLGLHGTLSSITILVYLPRNQFAIKFEWLGTRF